MTDSLASLVERLEKAAEGSRELDAQVWACVCAVPDFTDYRIAEGMRVEFEALEDGSVQCWAKDDKRAGKIGRRPAPHYTTSVDAALTLVPDGMLIKLFNDFPGDDVWWAEVVDFDDGEFTTYRSDEHGAATSSAALAVCKAALRARQNREGDAC